MNAVANGGGQSYYHCAGIGCGYYANDTKNKAVDVYEKIIINGGKVYAQGYGDGAGIGCIKYTTGGDIEIHGGTVVAVGKYYSQQYPGIGGWSTFTGKLIVTGGSVISALGNDWSSIFESLKQKKNKIKYMPEWEKYQGMNTKLASPVDFVPPDFPRKKIRGMGRIALMAITSTDNALKDAGLAESPELKAGRCGVAYGSSAGSIDSLLDFYSMLITNTANKISATTDRKSTRLNSSH